MHKFPFRWRKSYAQKQKIKKAVSEKPLPPFSLLDKISLLLLIGIIIKVYYWGLTAQQISQSAILWLIIASLGIPFILLTIQFYSLRKKVVYIAWLALSILLLGVYPIFYSKASLIGESILQYTKGLKTSFTLLIVFQLLRQAARYSSYTELALPSKSGIGSYDEVEGRPLNLWDYFSFIVFVLIIFLCCKY